MAGNSGSPILSTSYEVRGIIHSSSDGKLYQLFEDQRSQRMYVMQWKFGPQNNKMESKNRFVYSPFCYNAKAMHNIKSETLNLDLLEVELDNKIDDRLRYRFSLKSKIHKNKVFINVKNYDKMHVDMNYSFGLKTSIINPCKS